MNWHNIDHKFITQAKDNGDKLGRPSPKPPKETPGKGKDKGDRL